ncbi:thioesterase domain-containing protein [Vibrio sp. PP-XX7]
MGWSFGGTLAYEVAAQLLGQDQEIEFLGLLDTMAVLPQISELLKIVSKSALRKKDCF